MPIKDLKPLEGLTALEDLDLSKTELASLHRALVQSAAKAILVGAKVPPKEIEALKKAVPGAEVLDKAD